MDVCMLVRVNEKVRDDHDGKRRSSNTVKLRASEAMSAGEDEDECWGG